MSDRKLLEIHRYWFGELSSPDSHRSDTVQLWFQKNDETDRHIAGAFGHLLADYSRMDWNVRALSREEGVALVVLFDQFPRNLFRTTGEQFAYDGKAREIAVALTAGGLDRFFPIERDILSLPFQHHEDCGSQDLSVLMAAKLAVDGPQRMLHMHRNFLDFATKHRDIVRKFGRFPHRNVYLGRDSTPEELAFIQEHGRGY